MKFMVDSKQFYFVEFDNKFKVTFFLIKWCLYKIDFLCKLTLNYVVFGLTIIIFYKNWNLTLNPWRGNIFLSSVIWKKFIEGYNQEMKTSYKNKTSELKFVLLLLND